MARKSVVAFKIISAGDLSSNITSEPTNVLNLDLSSIILRWTGTTPVGEIKVEARNDDKDTWVELDLGGTISISGNTGDHLLLFNLLPFTEIRLQYVRTSGIGSIDAISSFSTVGA